MAQDKCFSFAKIQIIDIGGYDGSVRMHTFRVLVRASMTNGIIFLSVWLRELRARHLCKQ
jgi:hypothetical protein